MNPIDVSAIVLNLITFLTESPFAYSVMLSVLLADGYLSYLYFTKRSAIMIADPSRRRPRPCGVVAGESIF